MEGAKKSRFSSAVGTAAATPDAPLLQMNSGGIIMAIHYDGILRINGGIEYMSGKRKLKRIIPSISFEDFVAKMYTVSECSPESTVLNFQYSICGKRCNDLDNEEDLNDMFDCIPQYSTEVWIFILKARKRHIPPPKSKAKKVSTSVECTPASLSRSRFRSQTPCPKKAPSTEHKSFDYAKLLLPRDRKFDTIQTSVESSEESETSEPSELNPRIHPRSSQDSVPDNEIKFDKNTIDMEDLGSYVVRSSNSAFDKWMAKGIKISDLQILGPKWERLKRKVTSLKKENALLKKGNKRLRSTIAEQEDAFRSLEEAIRSLDLEGRIVRLEGEIVGFSKGRNGGIIACSEEEEEPSNESDEVGEEEEEEEEEEPHKAWDEDEAMEKARDEAFRKRVPTTFGVSIRQGSQVSVVAHDRDEEEPHKARDDAEGHMYRRWTKTSRKKMYCITHPLKLKKKGNN